jgi:hypothetical protein
MPSVGPGLQVEGAISAGIVGTWAVLWLMAVLAWAAGLVLVGGPAWFILHRSGLTRRFHAMIAGALLAGVGGYVVGVLAYAPFPVAWFIAFSLIGMLAGWLVWRRAYGPTSRSLPASE